MNPYSPDLACLCIHTATTKPWPLETAVRKFAAQGVAGITVWRDTLAGRDPVTAGHLIREHGLSVVSVCRGGFFPATTAAGRTAAIDDNRACIDQAAALGAPLIVLVCGAVPGQPLTESRKQIADGIAAILPHAKAAGVKLAVEPLHPMYAADRSAINTMAQARYLCRQLASPSLGIAVDVYHVWWDDSLEQEIELAGRDGTLFAFHVCDWRIPTTDLLNDRGLMGEGCIPIAKIRSWVERAGFRGFNEVEIFSNRHWSRDQDGFLSDIVAAYQQHC